MDVGLQLEMLVVIFYTNSVNDCPPTTWKTAWPMLGDKFSPTIITPSPLYTQLLGPNIPN